MSTSTAPVQLAAVGLSSGEAHCDSNSMLRIKHEIVPVRAHPPQSQPSARAEMPTAGIGFNDDASHDDEGDSAS
jgi:hypothetical protein